MHADVGSESREIGGEDRGVALGVVVFVFGEGRPHAPVDAVAGARDITCGVGRGGGGADGGKDEFRGREGFEIFLEGFRPWGRGSEELVGR